MLEINQVLELSSKKIRIFKNGDCLYGDSRGLWIVSKKYLFICIGLKIFRISINPFLTKNQFIRFNPLSRKFFIIIITCLKNISRINNLRNLWIKDLKKLGIPYLFVIGNNRNKSFIKGDILSTACPDNYESLPKKIYKSIEFVSRNFDFEYIYKIDDDCILNPLSLFTIDTGNSLYIGKDKKVSHDFNRYWHKGKCENKKLNLVPYPINRIFHNTHHAKGESGYFLHHTIIPIILGSKKYIYTDIYEDKVIGDVLRFNSIYMDNKPNYKPKLFDKPYNTQYSKCSLVVDVPERYMTQVYGQTKLII